MEPFELAAQPDFRHSRRTLPDFHHRHLMLASDPVASRGPLDDLERCRVFRPLIDHLVDNAPLHCHFPSQEVVALERVLDLLERLAGVLHVDLVETLGL